MTWNPVPKFTGFLNRLFRSNQTGYRTVKVGEKVLKLEDESSVETTDWDQVPEKVRRELRKEYDVRDYDHVAKQVRSHVLEGKPPAQIAKQATKNFYVLNDVLDNPDLVDADTRGEAIEVLAETDPGWAKTSSIVTDGEKADLVDTDAYTDAEVDASGETTGPGTSSGYTSAMTGGELSGVASVSIDTGSGTVSVDSGSAAGGEAGGGTTGGGSTGGGSAGGGST